MPPAPTALVKFEQDSLPRRGYSVYTFSNCQSIKSVSGVIAKRQHDPGLSLNIRATDLTEAQLNAIFRTLGIQPPVL